MPTVTQGNNAAVAMAGGETLSIINRNSDLATLVYSAGATAPRMPTATQGRNLVGPFLTGGTVTITATSGDVFYEQASRPVVASPFVSNASASAPLMSSGINVGYMRLDANVALTLPATVAEQVSRYDLLVKQGAIGGFVATFPASVAWPAGTEPQPPLQANDFAIYQFWTDGSGTYQGARISPAVAALGYDRFGRADSNTTLGSAEIGGAWTAHAGTWGISGLSAYCVTPSGDSVASISVGVANHTVHCDVTPNNVGAQPGVCGRVVDANNYWLALPSAPNAAATLTLFKRVAGAYTAVDTVNMPAGSFAVGQPVRLTLRFVGNTISMYCNGILRQNAPITDAALNTATRAGIRTNDALASKWNNFVAVTSL